MVDISNLILESSKIDQRFKFNPFIFFSTGESLVDKDRDLNVDSNQIQKFFKPIDNIFGDYEVRKKFNVHEILYLNSCFNKVKISPNNDLIRRDLENQRIKKKNKYDENFQLKLTDENGNLLDEFKNEESLLLFLILFDKKKLIILNECFTTNRNELLNTSKETFFKNLSKILGKDLNVLQVFALDPIKLIQCIEMDQSRYLHFINIIERNDKIPKEIITKFFDKILEKRLETPKEINLYEFDSINLFLNEWGINGENENDKNQLIKLVKLFQSRKYKLKNFERHRYFKTRIGYENGNFVLFLHPYESESHNPVRIPGGQ